MEESKNKNDLKKYLTQNNLVLFGAVIIAFVLLVLSVEAMQKNFQLQRQVDEGLTANEVQTLENENLRLQQMYFKTNEFLELQARDKLNKAFAGEHLVYLPRIDTEVTIDTGEAARPIDPRSNFERWIEFFFGNRQ